MIKEIQHIIELEKARNIYESRIDKCNEGKYNAIRIYRDGPEYADELIDTYDAF